MRISVVAALALAVGGCTADWAKENNAAVTFYITDINGGAALLSDVGNPLPDPAIVGFGLRYKNLQGGLPEPNWINAVAIERYEVRYYRSDGRNTEGVDVPYRISGNISTGLDVGDNGSVVIEVVRAQAKLEPPLRNLRAVGTDFGGNALVLTCFAELTLHGRTPAGQAVSASGRLQIDFADWP